MRPRVVVILVNWNNFADTAECLQSLQKIRNPSFATVVVDNGSTDGSLELIRARFPEVVLIAFSENRGLAAANNAGIRHALDAGAEFGLLLNNDTVADPQILEAFIVAAEQFPEAAMFGAKIYYYSDPKRIWWAISRWDGVAGTFLNLGRDQLDDGVSFSQIEEMDYANGCALFFRTEAVAKIGTMDERIFMYFEEIDWCFRARQQHYRIMFVPQAKVWHKVASSWGGKTSPVIAYFETRNQLLWARKNLPPRERAAAKREVFRRFFPSTTEGKGYALLRRMYWDIRFLMSPKGKAKLRGAWDYRWGHFGNCPAGIRKSARGKIGGRRKRILILTVDFRFPLINGGQIRTWNFIRALGRDHDLYLFNIYHEDLERMIYAEPEGKPLFKKFWNVPFAPEGNRQRLSYARRFFNLICGIPWEMSHPDKPRIEQELMQALTEQPCDYILARYIAQAQYVFGWRKDLQAKVIVDLDDVAPIKTRRWFACKGYGGGYDYWRRKFNLFLLDQYHKRFLNTVDSCLVCSLEDQSYVLRRGWSRRVRVVPNAMATDVARGCLPPTESKTVLFVGSLCYPPNIEGAVWFAKEVLPLIRKEEPAARFLIVGSCPREDILALQDAPHILIHANVEDVTPFYAQAALAVVPVRIAGGTRIKILEAGRLGRPVVVTSVGAEGLNLEHGRHCLKADTPEEFARACLLLLANPELNRRLVRENSEFINQNYRFENIQEKITALFQDGPA